MWIFTTLGFFSVVAHRDDQATVLVRAPAREDLEALRNRHISGHHTLEWEGSDYRFRLVASRDDWAHVAREFAAGIDYSNFKDAVAERQGTSRARLYSPVWQTMFALEEASA